VPRFLSFLGLALFAHLLLVAAWRQTAGADHAAVRADESFFSGPKRVRILFAGDSHTRNAIEPEALGNVVNVAVGGEHYVKLRYRLQWLLSQDRVQVDAVVLPLEATSFVDWKADSYEPEGVWGRYVDFLEVGRRRGERTAYAGRWVKANLFPYVGEADTWAQYALGAAAFRDEGGGGMFALMSAAQRARQSVEVAERHFDGQRVDDPTMVWAFRSLLRFLEQRDIRVVLVAWPVTRTYYQAALPYGGRQFAREQILQPLLDKGRVEFLDLERVLFDQHTLFLDADHLNPVGARRLSSAIRPKLARMGLLDRSE
jgi:hypothetical protein